MITEDQFAIFVGSSFRLAMPLLLAATGEMISEKAGVLNMSLEGMMLSAAFAGAVTSWAVGDPIVGLFCGVLVAVCIALLQAFLSVTVRANQIVVGIGFNILALGATTYLYREILGAASSEEIPGIGKWSVPILSDIPMLGVALFQQTSLFYCGLLAVFACWALMRYSSFGLAVRAVGEDPAAADKAGVDVARVRYKGVLCAGAMAGLAGCFISLADIHTFTEDLTNGVGYLALAAVIFGAWTGWRILVACLLFGSATALQFLLPYLGVVIPTGALLMLPYVLALLAVGGLVGRLRAPAALGIPFERSR